MQTEDLKQLIETALEGADVAVQGDGSNFEARIVYSGFEGLNTIKQHKLVYKALGDSFQNNEIHAMTLKTYTPEQWQQASKLQVA